MLAEKLDQIVEEEIKSRIGELQQQLMLKDEDIFILNNNLSEVIALNNKLLSQIKQIEMTEILKEVVNEDNFSSILSILKLKQKSWNIDGMHSEKIPLWFKVIFRYYEDKEKVFALMDLFNIKYPEWATKYKMPYDYNEEELLVFADISKYSRGVTNGANFEYNIGFFWENVRANKGETKDILTSKHSFCQAIPWQLVLANPLWKNEKPFKALLKNLDKPSNGYNFFLIQRYTEITEEQAKLMAAKLPKDKLWDVHKEFVKYNKNILKECPELVEKFSDKINDNQYTPFYYLNFPVETQKDFIRGYNGYYKKLDLIKKMEISKEEKLEFLIEFANKELD